MTAFLQRFHDDTCLFLGLDSGEYAVYHGLSVWSIFDPKGNLIDTFDTFFDDAENNIHQAIINYENNHANKLGRIG